MNQHTRLYREAQADLRDGMAALDRVCGKSGEREMKVSLQGLFANLTASLNKADREYYGFCLNELRQHIEETVRGEHSLQEFADHYCIARACNAHDELVAALERARLWVEANTAQVRGLSDEASRPGEEMLAKIDAALSKSRSSQSQSDGG